MIVIILVIGLFINVIISLEVGKLAKEKNIGYNTAIWLSFLLTPIIGLLAVIASTPKTEEEKIVDLKKDNFPQIFILLWVLAILLILYVIFN